MNRTMREQERNTHKEREGEKEREREREVSGSPDTIHLTNSISIIFGIIMIS